MRLTPGRLFWLKCALHTGFILPLFWLVWGVAVNQLGGDPVQYIIHFTGKGTLHGLMLTLLISPLSKGLKMGPLMQTRRLVGLWTFSYAVLHLLAFVSLDLLFAWSMLLTEVLKRPYLLLGMAGLLILTALALTSLKSIQRRLGAHWQRLHNWVYLVALLAPVHYLWSVKSELIEPSLYLLCCLWLLWLRRDKLLKAAFIRKVFAPQSS
ncbi:protein-methionine-sulfoxide reductase heme-binding subunit MsrQ [Shewanella litorisediminis]|uniref:Protein-methionine-sulfoxide reductase heme-binding subunit MsrQ n=1 Tax=Shewanella litorisediminis TaxID=1173586 RepID=A0ABX7FYS8_9GAMM|nr:protein-methionine-sulfoxide reductase heme-binding subunit MsrQ [Shewanella litorisediminis]MCL2918851.1 protein-methionine-sulfoxide reductase heme-binding subunit MsrQ [Shewanella litorisediminis]QRH00183.1 protein-methionine-sulfoxide reductase heme-binding subunit MsrQ [Shewanella litorisediminis]